MKKQILLQLIFPIFLSNVFSIKGMMTAQKARSSLLQNVGRYRGLTKVPSLRKPVSNVVFQEKVYNPFSMWIQKRSYSDSTPKQPDIGLLEKIKSFFVVQDSIPELRTKGIAGIMHELLYPEHTKIVVDRAGLTRDIRSFDKNDLEKAKEKIGRILEVNESYKTSFVGKNSKSWFGSEKDESYEKLRKEDSVFKVILYSFYGDNFNKWNYRFEGTILDEVLYKIFSGEWNSGFFTTTDNVLHYIQLAQWLADKGLTINQNNERNYVLGYKHLMREYKDLYRPRHFGRDTMKCIDEDSFKKIFAALDPILERFISQPELQQELHQFQQERREIEADSQAYRKKMEEEDRRDAYISKKAKILEFEYINRTGDWNKGSHEFLKYVEFDEAEYKEWKETGFLRGEKEKLEQERQWKKQWESEENNFDQETSSQSKDNAIQLLKKDLGLTNNASAIDVKKKFREISKLNHPDTRKEETATMTQEEYKKLSGFYSDISEALDKQAREEAAQQKAQEAKE